MNSQQLKISAARAALGFIHDGMKLGIGTGSTADEFTRLLAPKVNEGLDIQAVPTSERTDKLCQELGIKTQTLEELPQLDLTIDGADELDAELQLVKGGGGALLREKIVAEASSQMIVIADESKLVDQLGAFPLPIEIVPFGMASTKIAIEALAAKLNLVGDLSLRLNKDGSIFVTDGGHYIFDASFSRISVANELCRSLNQIPGVVENGLFIDIASKAIIAKPDGVQIIEINE